MGIAVGAYVGIAVLTLFLFSLLRPNNKIVYQPKLKYAEGDKRPPPISDGFFGWCGPTFKITEEEMLPLIGLDAVTFLRFSKMMRNICTVLAIMMCAVLIPVDVAYNLTAGKSSSTRQSGLNMLTMADVSGSFIWAHVGLSYLGTIVALGFSEYEMDRPIGDAAVLNADEILLSQPLVCLSLAQLSTDGPSQVDLVPFGRIPEPPLRSISHDHGCQQKRAL